MAVCMLGCGQTSVSGMRLSGGMPKPYWMFRHRCLMLDCTRLNQMRASVPLNLATACWIDPFVLLKSSAACVLVRPVASHSLVTASGPPEVGASMGRNEFPCDF